MGPRGVPLSCPAGESRLGEPRGRWFGGAAARRGAARVLPVPHGRLPLGRQRACDRPPAAPAPRPLADLVRGRGHAAVLSPSPFGVLGRAPAVGRLRPRIPSGQRGAPRGGGLDARPCPARTLLSLAVAGGARLRPAPGL